MSPFARVVCGVDGSEPSRAGERLAARLVEPGGSVASVEVQPPDGGSAHPADLLLAELERADATLAVVGSTGQSRPVGIALGSVATMVLHEAPCSVLVARPVADVEGWPRRIVVGSDGSGHADAAATAARRLAARFDAALDLLAVDEGDPVTVLAEASEDADLLVVGSRGLRGIRALGSVSERVAHEARCPVLVVRGTP